MKLTEYKNNRVLIVDDQQDIHDDFVEMLKSNGRRSTDALASAFTTEEDKPFLPEFEITHAMSGEEACQLVASSKEANQPIAVAYIDIRMPPGIDGIETTRRIRAVDRDIEIVIMTAYTDKSLPEIVHDMELLHKVLYIRKPFTYEEIQQITLSLVGKWNIEQEAEQMKAEVLRLRTELETTYSFDGLVGSSPPMQQVYALMKQATESDIAVFIRGESGTGKELIAKSFHYNSRRRQGPFVAINCAALPEGLIESELFGHEKGAFTGATERRIGAFERAEGGTIFLDEIADMQPMLQAKLLRVLQEKEIQRLGGTVTHPIDVRVISATNKELEDAIRTGTFREDLFYRLAAFPILIPPLRQRREDIPLLANHFLEQYAERNNKSISGLSTGALRVLLQYDWPGNVRELENAIERAVLLETTEVLQVANLPPQLSPLGAEHNDFSASTAVLPLKEVERQAMAHALKVLGNNVSATARALGCNRATLYRKLKKYNLITVRPRGDVSA